LAVNSTGRRRLAVNSTDRWRSSNGGRELYTGGHRTVGHPLRDPSCKPGLCKDLSSCLACCIPCARVGASRDAEDNKAKTKPCGYPHKALHLPCLSAHVFSGLPCGKTPRGVRCQREPLVGFGCCCSGGDLCYFSHFSS
jgi:hypothetical protein